MITSATLSSSFITLRTPMPANEEADDAAEFGDDIREKEPGDDLDEDDTKGGSNPGSKPGSAADLRRLGGAPRDGDPPAGRLRHSAPSPAQGWAGKVVLTVLGLVGGAHRASPIHLS